jgi:hypothetical protein
MEIDLDIAENFYVKLNDGATVGTSALAGGLKSPESVRAYGLWSFTIAFNVFARVFLSRFVLNEERRRLLVIDRITANPILDLRVPHVEALAFDTISMLVESSAVFDHGMIPEILESILGRPENHDWCHLFNNDNQRKRWAKDKARKYSKMILRFQEKVSRLDAERHVTTRKRSVEFLLQKLQQSVTKFRSLPIGLEDAITSTRDPCNCVKACKFLHQWTHDDLDQMRVHVFQLLNSAEEVTGFLRKATGDAYPEVKSVLNEKWEMRESMQISRREFSKESTCTAIRDVNYVNAILEEFKCRQVL